MIPARIRRIPAPKVQPGIFFTISGWCWVRRISITLVLFTNLLPAAPNSIARIRAKTSPRRNPHAPKRYAISLVETRKDSKNFQISQETGMAPSMPRRADTAVRRANSLKNMAPSSRSTSNSWSINSLLPPLLVSSVWTTPSLSTITRSQNDAA